MRKTISNQPVLADVAARARVSAGTASHVLNGNHKARIAPATQERVRKAALELGYRPNTFARSLLGKKTKSLGLMAGNLENPFFVSVAREAWERAHEIGYQLMLDTQLSSSEVFRGAARPGPWPVDGLLLWAETVQDVEKLLGREALGLPMVYLGLMSEAECDAVTFDFYAGMRMLMDYLSKRGYRKPMMIIPTEGEGDQGGIRARAFRDYCTERNLSGSINLLPNHHQPNIVSAFQGGQSLAAMPVAIRPDVAVCYNDQTAIGVYNGLRRGGLRVPQDIAVTGFDGLQEGQCLDLPLTTAAIPIDLACGSAIEMLVHRIEHTSENAPNRIALPIRLLAGATA